MNASGMREIRELTLDEVGAVAAGEACVGGTVSYGGVTLTWVQCGGTFGAGVSWTDSGGTKHTVNA